MQILLIELVLNLLFHHEHAPSHALLDMVCEDMRLDPLRTVGALHRKTALHHFLKVLHPIVLLL